MVEGSRVPIFCSVFQVSSLSQGWIRGRFSDFEKHSCSRAVFSPFLASRLSIEASTLYIIMFKLLPETRQLAEPQTQSNALKSAPFSHTCGGELRPLTAIASLRKAGRSNARLPEVSYEFHASNRPPTNRPCKSGSVCQLCCFFIRCLHSGFDFGRTLHLTTGCGPMALGAFRFDAATSKGTSPDLEHNIRVSTRAVESIAFSFTTLRARS